MPSSTTATSGLRPQLEQRERQADVVVQVAPCSETRVYRADRNSAVTSFVVVLPALPVIATTFAPDRRRTSRATSCSARVVSSTSIRSGAGPAVLPRAGRRRCHHRAGRARGQRGGDELVPVEPIAADRDEQVARRDRPRVDRHALDPAIRGRPTPAVRRSRRRSPRRSARSDPRRYDHPRAAAPPRQRRARHLHVVERQRPSPMTWYFSCPLPAISTRSPGRASRTAFSIAARRSTIASDGVGLAARAAARCDRPA